MLACTQLVLYPVEVLHQDLVKLHPLGCHIFCNVKVLQSGADTAFSKDGESKFVRGEGVIVDFVRNLM